MLHRKREKSAAGARRRQLWQQRLAAARAAYADTLANMDRWEALYNGSRRLTDADGRPARDSSNVRNIAYELVESQVDSTLPLPRVEAIHAEDTELARSIEAVLRHQIQLRGLADLNDLQERTVPIQGGSFWLVEWDPRGGGHCTLGQLAITPLHPRQVIPQPGVCEIDKMDYLFVQMAQTKQSIFKRYGVDVTACGEQTPDLRGEGEPPREELVTQNIAFYRNRRGGVGMFSWVEDVTLEDLEDYQARRRAVCADCGAEAEPGTEWCPVCGGRMETGPVDWQTAPADIVPPGPERERAVLLADGTPALGEDGLPLTQWVAAAPQAPCYRPGVFPVVLRRNVSRSGSLLGGSDVEVIRDQQDAIKKMGAKIDEKILKGGSYVTLPEGVRIETTDRELKIIRVRTPAEKALIGVVNVQPDVSKEMTALEQNYQWAKSTLGITDAYQGKYDSSAISGTAKQFSANQAAGRLQSKRDQKNQAYARLYELMFRYLLAYADQPVPYAERLADGSQRFAHFDRWAFLKQDAAGEWYWNDEFLFSVDPSATQASNRSVLWQQLDDKYRAGAFGPASDAASRRLYWTMLARTDFPHAQEVKTLLEQEGGEEDALPLV